MAPERKSKTSASGLRQCDVCGKYFSKDLSRHKKTHEKPTIKCPYPDCDHKGFHQRVNLQAHIDRVHLGARRHICPHSWRDEHGRVTPCAARFQEQGILIRHRTKLHGYQPNSKGQKLEPRFRDSATQLADRQRYEEVVPKKDAERVARGGRRAATPAPPVVQPSPSSSTASSTPPSRSRHTPWASSDTRRGTAAPQTPFMAPYGGLYAVDSLLPASSTVDSNRTTAARPDPYPVSSYHHLKQVQLPPQSSAVHHLSSQTTHSSGHGHGPTSNFVEMLDPSGAFLAPQAPQSYLPDFLRYDAPGPAAAPPSAGWPYQAASFSPYSDHSFALGTGTSMNTGFANALASDMPPPPDPLYNLDGPFYATAPYPPSSSSVRPAYPAPRGVQDSYVYSYGW
ncbi:hypothetical protein BV20DRAFT_980141 [Pilatotrama ljubarskyi]|nr:hypothetical protein BV20DRAFT_980141 [Pilatotrama ljubarskyi]